MMSGVLAGFNAKARAARSLSIAIPSILVTQIPITFWSSSKPSANIISLSMWNLGDDMTKILSIPKSRYQILEDRRAEGVVWLYTATVHECICHTDLAGG
jgi:hypothetical protein